MTTRTGRICTWMVALALVAGLAVAAEQGEKEAPMEHMSPEAQAMMDAYMKAGEPGEEHAELAEMSGTWKATVKSFMGPGEPTVSEGEFTREMTLDGRVLSERFEGDFMGRPFVGRAFTGYDNAREMYWSIWMDSMSTGVMTSWGVWDEAEQAVVMQGTTTDPTTGQPMAIKSVLRTPEPGTEIFEMWEPHGEGGAMVRTMEITSVRQ